jgi:hypothetical protein
VGAQTPQFESAVLRALASDLNMRRLGITTETFAVGMEVTIKGPRSVAPGTHSVNPEQVFLPDGTEIRAAPGQPSNLPRGIY